MRIFFVIPFSVFIFLSSCSNDSPTKGVITQEVNFTAQLNPLFDSQLYPSLLLALSYGVGTENGADNSPASQLAPFTVTASRSSQEDHRNPQKVNKNGILWNFKPQLSTF